MSTAKGTQNVPLFSGDDAKEAKKRRQVVNVTLFSANVPALNEICQKFRDIATQTNAKIRGPIPLPTKRICIPVRKSPCGNGTSTYDHYELKVHKRRIEFINPDANSVMLLMRLPADDNVRLEIDLNL